MSDQRIFNEEALIRASQCWCEPETSGIEMDIRLALAVAKAIEGWMDEANRYAKNAEYWRDKYLSETGAAA